ncbi:LysM peptidoglycan-binding domain-containing protein [Massilia cellulosiltytica]
MNRIYVVKKGDTLTGIAAREKVDRYELASLNDIHNHNLIKKIKYLYCRVWLSR